MMEEYELQADMTASRVILYFLDFCDMTAFLTAFSLGHVCVTT